MRFIQAVLAALALALLPACTSEPAPLAQPAAAASARAVSTARAPELPDHDPALAHKLVAEGALLLDVRTPDEFNDKHLPGAVNIPVDDLEGRLDEVKKLVGGDAQKPIVVYCRSGARAGRAKTMLGAAGFAQVTNLGGIAEWDGK